MIVLSSNILTTILVDSSDHSDHADNSNKERLLLLEFQP